MTWYPHEVELTVERNDDEHTLVVRGAVCPGSAGRRWGHPDTWSPDEPTEVELHGVAFADGGKAWPDGADGLTKEERERAEELLLEAHGDVEPPEPDEAW